MRHNHKYSKGDIVILTSIASNNNYNRDKEIILKLMIGATGTIKRAQFDNWKKKSAYNVEFKTSNRKGQPVEVTFQVYEDELELAFRI